MERDIPYEMLASGPVREIRLDLTTRCNLRCVYCAVSQSTYRGTDMPAELVRRATELVARLSRYRKLSAVHINGHGETTFMVGWLDVCRTLLAQNLPLVLTTNLAKHFSSDELNALARMHAIAVSIDTCDRDLLRRMRRRVDVGQIVANIKLIREASRRLDHRPPNFWFCCGLYDKNSLLVEDFARFAVALGIVSVSFWNVTKWDHARFPYQNTDVQEHDRAYPLDELSDEELRPRIDAITSGIAILKRNGIVVHVNGEFVSALAHRLNYISEESESTNSAALPVGMTRDCIDPWTYVEFETNGDVKPCCARTGVGNLAREDLSQILDGEPMRWLRAGLLSGTPDPGCVNCRLRAPIKSEDLNAKVRALLHENEEQAIHAWLRRRFRDQRRRLPAGVKLRARTLLARLQGW